MSTRTPDSSDGPRAVSHMRPSRTKRWLRVFAWLALVLLALLAGLVSLVLFWVGPTVDSRDVANLHRGVARMPGVASVHHSYEPGESFLDSGSLYVGVTMEPDATTEQTLAVVDAVYGQFRTTERAVDANLGIRRGRTHILLHTQDPHAGAGAVLAVARFALEVPNDGERATADVVARDDLDSAYNGGRMVSEVRLHLGHGSDQSDIEPRIGQVGATGTLPPGTDFWTLAADGSGLGGSRGLPTAADVAEWHELNAVAAPGTFRVELGPYQEYSSSHDYGFADVSLHAEPRPTKDQLTALKRRFMQVLGAHNRHYVLNVTVNGDDAIWLSRPGSFSRP